LASQAWSLEERAFSGIGVTLSMGINMGLVLTIASDPRVTGTIGKVVSCLESGTHFWSWGVCLGSGDDGRSPYGVATWRCLFPAPFYSRLFSIPSSSLFQTLFLGLCPMLLSSRARRRCGIGLPYCIDSRDLTSVYIALTPPRTADHCAHSLRTLSPSPV
jgi:hypothetical protein